MSYENLAEELLRKGSKEEIEKALDDAYELGALRGPRDSLPESVREEMECAVESLRHAAAMAVELNEYHRDPDSSYMQIAGSMEQDAEDLRQALEDLRKWKAGV